MIGFRSLFPRNLYKCYHRWLVPGKKLIPKIFLNSENDFRGNLSINLRNKLECWILIYENHNLDTSRWYTVAIPLIYFSRTVIWYLMKTTNKCSRATVPKKSSSVHLCVVLSFFLLDCRSRAPFFFLSRPPISKKVEKIFLFLPISTLKYKNLQR